MPAEALRTTANVSDGWEFESAWTWNAVEPDPAQMMVDESVLPFRIPKSDTEVKQCPQCHRMTRFIAGGCPLCGYEEGDGWHFHDARMAKPKAKKGEDVRAKPQKCKECKEPAIKSLVWAEGMAYVPVCAKHEGPMRKHLKAQDGEGAFQEVQIKQSRDEGRVPQVGNGYMLMADYGNGQVHVKQVPQVPSRWQKMLMLTSPFQGYPRKFSIEPAPAGSTYTGWEFNAPTAG